MASNLRIAFVHSFYSSQQPSGENAVVQAEVAALRRAGHEVEVFAARTDELRGDRLYLLRTAFRVATGSGHNPSQAVSDFAPDIVHIHNLFPNFGRRWVSDLHVPLLHTVHNYRPLCANGMFFRDGQICTLCVDGDRWAGVRHGCYRGSRTATIPTAWANRRGAGADPLFVRADRLIVLSERQRRIYADAGVPAARMLVWPHFLPDALDPGPAHETTRSAWLFVGRLSPEKGILPLLERWPAGRRLVVVGDGQQRQAVEDAASGKQVEVLGSLPRDRVVGLMRRSVGLVFPSRWYETFGLVYIEAMAAGLPVLAFEPSTVADFVRRDRTGTVASWDRPLDQQLDACERSFVNQRARCRAVFEERLTEAAFLERVQALYAELRTS